MDSSASGVKTVIHVISESPYSVVVQYPADLSTGVINILAGGCSLPVNRLTLKSKRRQTWLYSMEA
jgi:hypothetical protein